MSYVILLTGLPGCGKLTVAARLDSLLRNRGVVARVVDNHYVYNVILDLLPAGLSASQSHAAWSAIETVRETVFRTVESLSPASWVFVFTEYLELGDEWFVERVKSIAAMRRSPFVPIHLTCELQELEHRVASSGRAPHHKSVSVEDTRRLYGTSDLLKIEHDNSLVLDNTRISAEFAANRILDHLHRCR